MYHGALAGNAPFHAEGIWAIMHLTNNEPGHSDPLASDAKDAGAPAEENILHDCMESEFSDWYDDNRYFLEAGLPVDLLDLRSRLNTAFAKSCIES